MKVIYLDQNKWIDLARASFAPDQYPELRSVLERLCEMVEAGEVALPLTAANIVETQKVNRPERRFRLAYTQVVLSGARVFRGLRRRLEVEVSRILSRRYAVPWSEPEALWFLSEFFVEATAEADDPRLQASFSPRLLAWVASHPQQALMSYLVNAPEDGRVAAIRRFTKGCDALRLRIEDRRSRHKAEDPATRRKIYSAIIAFEQQECLIEIAATLGLPWTCLGDSDGATFRAVICETPAFRIEREISLRLEAQSRQIHINDMRDMQTFCTVLPYADIVVAERQFINLARQAGLDRRYGTRMATDLLELPKLLREGLTI